MPKCCSLDTTNLNKMIFYLGLFAIGLQKYIETDMIIEYVTPQLYCNFLLKYGVDSSVNEP